MWQRRRVVLVGFEGVQLLDLAGPADVFDGATRALSAGLDEDRVVADINRTLAPEIAALPAVPAYELVLATPSGRPVRSSCGVRLAADARLSDLDAREIDTLLVAGGVAMAEPMADPLLIDQLRRLAEHARRTSSVCGGAFLLAEAGLLSGKRATTHWAGCEALRDGFPEVTVEPDLIFVRDGRVRTSAGVSAGIDLALALVEEDHGSKVARTVARWMVVFLQRPGGQSQFSARLELPVPSESPIRAVVDGIVADPGADHRISELAERAALSERQLSRIFVREAMTTPGRFVERVRVEAARDLLETTSMSVDAVAARCGFGSDETLRRAFVRVVGIKPSEYRLRFARTSGELAGASRS